MIQERDRCRELAERLGRNVVEDERDREFPMSAVAPRHTETERTWRYWWPSGWWGDQGQTPQCVAYAWLHWAEDGPVTRAPRRPGAGPLLDPAGVYRRAQEQDRWPGTSYDGTSVRAGAKVLASEGVVEEYRWAWSAETALGALLERGPVVVGSWWHWDMFEPDPADGVLDVDGGRAGGHAYLANGVNLDRGLVRIKNSWGRAWGRNGYAYLRIDDFARLLEEDGEACLALPGGEGVDG